MKVRNGKIDFFRFVFCLIIVLFHINLDFWNWGRFYFGERLSLARMGGRSRVLLHRFRIPVCFVG